jgi:hypothetical protein
MRSIGENRRTRRHRVERFGGRRRGNFIRLRTFGGCELARTAERAVWLRSGMRLASATATPSVNRVWYYRKPIQKSGGTMARSTSRLGRHDARTGRPRSRRDAKPADFYTCPRCGKASVYQEGRDLQNRPVFRCPSCNELISRTGLDHAHRNRLRED